MRNDAFEWVKLIGMYSNLMLWGLLLPRIAPGLTRFM